MNKLIIKHDLSQTTSALTWYYMRKINIGISKVKNIKVSHIKKIKIFIIKNKNWY